MNTEPFNTCWSMSLVQFCRPIFYRNTNETQTIATKRTTARFRFVYCPCRIQILYFRINNTRTFMPTHTKDRIHKEWHCIYVSWWRQYVHIYLLRWVTKRWKCILLINVLRTQYCIFQYVLWARTQKHTHTTSKRDAQTQTHNDVSVVKHKLRVKRMTKCISGMSTLFCNTF